ncbi:MAG: copper chaperone PCu(A)C [Mariprofundaceae bacterium]
MKRFLILFGLLVILPTYAAAEIMVEDAWVRLPPPVADTAAGYMTIRNSSDHDVKITSIATSAADHPEFHAMTMQDGMMHMHKMDKVIIPAKGKINFGPGGNHLMLIDLTKSLKTGEHLMITLETSDGESVMIHAEVKDMRNKSGKMQMPHDHHGAH